MKIEALLKVYQRILFVIYIALMGFFAVLSLQSGTDSSNTSNFVAEFIGKLFSITPDTSFNGYIRKLVGHFGYFCIFGLVSILFYLTFTNKKLWWKMLFHLGIGIIYILMTEFVFQMIADSRGPSFTDCLIDFSGFAILTCFVLVFYFLISKSEKEPFKEKTVMIYKVVVLCLYIISIIFYTVFSLLNGDTSNKVANGISQVIVDVTPGVNPSKSVSESSGTTQMFLRKLLGHLGYFGMIAFFSFLFYNPVKNYKKWAIHLFHFGAGILYAFLSEYLLEMLTSGRAARFTDFLTDTIGFLLSSGLMYLVFYYNYTVSKAENLF